MNTLDQIHLRAGKPVGIGIGAVSEAIIEAVIKSIVECIRFLGQVYYQVERQGATEFFIEQGHALKNLGLLAEVIDETILHLQPSQTHDT